MEYALAISLTLLVLLGILVVQKKKEKSLNKIVYSQSNIHRIIKPFLPREAFGRPQKESQSSKHFDKNNIRVLMIDNEAYWVYSNTFYTAETVDGEVNPETTRPVDTENLTAKEIEKMLFILDSLNQRKNNDSGSAGDKRV